MCASEVCEDMKRTESLREEVVSGDQLQTVVDDVHHPDLVAELVDADTDTVILDRSRCTLDHAVETHATSTKHKREDLDRV